MFESILAFVSVFVAPSQPLVQPKVLTHTKIHVSAPLRRGTLDTFISRSLEDKQPVVAERSDSQELIEEKQEKNDLVVQKRVIEREVRQQHSSAPVAQQSTSVSDVAPLSTAWEIVTLTIEGATETIDLSVWPQQPTKVVASAQADADFEVLMQTLGM